MPEELTPEERIARQRARREAESAKKAEQEQAFARELEEATARRNARDEAKQVEFAEQLESAREKSGGAMTLSLKLPEDKRATFLMLYQNEKKSESTLLLVSLFLGFLGVDRFMLGQTGAGLAKLLTFGGCGVWALIDWFMIMGATKNCNNTAAYKIYQQLKK